MFFSETRKGPARMSAVALVAFALLLPAGGPETTNVPTASSGVDAARPAGDVVPGSYIVVLEDGASLDRVTTRHLIPPAAMTATYRHALLGFTANLTAAAASRLAEDPAVRIVEPNRWFSVATTQASPPWGLDRTDERDLPLSGAYEYDTSGLGVKAYVIDSGVYGDHSELSPRVANGFSAFAGMPADEDCNGHGTHVAGTLAGTRSGVAKAATIVPVRVMNCKGGGTAEDILRGMDWVASQHIAGTPAVANMSIAAPGVGTVVDEAVLAGIAKGITYVVAAGNEDVDACTYSPANVPEALTVGASDITDWRGSFSNHGTCLDLFAPGVSIRSAAHNDPYGYATKHGTSMAAPHVAGVAARYLQSMPTATPAQVAAAVTNSATPSVVKGAGYCSPTSLLYAAPGSETAWTAASAPSSELSNSTSPTRITYGGSTVISGELTSGDVAVSCEAVQVQRKPRGTDTWKTFAGEGTDVNGGILVGTAPRRSTAYRLVYRGDAYKAATSPSRLVGVATKVTAFLNDTRVARGAKAKLSGKVAPSHAGTAVKLQRFRDDAWRNVDSSKLNSKSRYSFPLKTDTRGTYYYRVVKPGHTDHTKGTSKWHTLTVE